MDFLSYEIITQLVGVIGSAFIIGGYSFKADKTSKKIIVVGALLFTIHFLMIGAITAALMNLINFFRVGLSIKFHGSKKLFCVFIATYLICTVLSYDHWIDLFPLLSSLIGTFSMYFLSGLAFRYCVLIGSSCWLTHNLLAGSIGGIMTELFVLTATFTVIYRLYIDKRKASEL